MMRVFATPVIMGKRYHSFRQIGMGLGLHDKHDLLKATHVKDFVSFAKKCGAEVTTGGGGHIRVTPSSDAKPIKSWSTAKWQLSPAMYISHVKDLIEAGLLIENEDVVPVRLEGDDDMNSERAQDIGMDFTEIDFAELQWYRDALVEGDLVFEGANSATTAHADDADFEKLLKKEQQLITQLDESKSQMIHQIEKQKKDAELQYNELTVKIGMLKTKAAQLFETIETMEANFEDEVQRRTEEAEATVNKELAQKEAKVNSLQTQLRNAQKELHKVSARRKDELHEIEKCRITMDMRTSAAEALTAKALDIRVDALVAETVLAVSKAQEEVELSRYKATLEVTKMRLEVLSAIESLPTKSKPASNCESLKSGVFLIYAGVWIFNKDDPITEINKMLTESENEHILSTITEKEALILRRNYMHTWSPFQKKFVALQHWLAVLGVDRSPEICMLEEKLYDFNTAAKDAMFSIGGEHGLLYWKFLENANGNANAFRLQSIVSIEKYLRDDNDLKVDLQKFCDEETRQARMQAKVTKDLIKRFSAYIKTDSDHETFTIISELNRAKEEQTKNRARKSRSIAAQRIL